MEFQVSRDVKKHVDNPLSSAPRMKKSETKDSISSVDSDVSLSFDRRDSKSDEADSSDYDGEIKFVKNTNIDQDSGADSLDDTTSKELKKHKHVDVSSESPTESMVSMIERTTNDFVTPYDELANKICAQVEYYFSDENIIKDAFLLKHVKRNKEGYVSLKLISSFKKVKHLSRDWKVVGAALTRSKKLELNSQGTKLRRVNPLPLFDQTAPSRTILVAGLPIEKLTVESVAEVFKPCGEIALIRVLKPGRPVPPEVRQAIVKRPEWISIEEFAMVEFADSASARIATQMALGGAKVFELRHSVDKKRKHQPTKKYTLSRTAKEDNHNSSSCPSGSEPEDGRVRLKRGFQGYPMYHVHNTSYPFQAGLPSPDTCLSRKLSSCSISSAENGFIFRRLSSCSGSSSGSGRRYSTCSSGSETAFFHPSYSNNFCHRESRRSCCSSIGSPMECRESCYVANRRGSADYGSLSRRLSTYSRDTNFDTNIRRSSSLCTPNLKQNVFYRSRSNNSIAMTHVPENVMRMPSGPDGTRGFFVRSGKISTPVESTR